MKTADEFAKLLLMIKNNPGLQQIDLARLLGYDTAKVSRLCRVGISNGFISSNHRQLYKGPAFENRIQP